MMAGCAADRPVVVYMKDAEGDRLALEVNVAPLHDDEGRVVGGIETFHDITRRIHDMERAREIQRRLMPRNMPELPGARLQALYRPQDLVGGDIYDVTTLEDGRIDLLLADLRGHGVSAALSTTWLSALRRDIARFAGHPRAYVRALNARLSGRGARSTFATAFYGVYNPRSHRLNYSIAGHPPPLHHHAESGETTRLDGHGMPLGIDADQTYGEDTVELAPGDAVLFYTDGITETFDSEGRPLGTDGLAAALREFLGNDRPHEALYDHVLRRCGPARPDDDMTLMLLQRDGD
jgi:sigma-B regulation protein RsbU (phosphoserine phosphatase)